LNDAAAMGVALGLARRALGTTAPNPPVGAVLVRDGRVIGEGWTRPPGGPHAEVVALADARARGEDPRGATMVVTLERLLGAVLLHDPQHAPFDALEGREALPARKTLTASTDRVGAVS
jgi:hypothetical protein